MLNNDITLNAILFYADYLSLREQSIPVTDNCKYFFIHKQPINSAYIAGVEPFYDEDNPYFQQAKFELSKIEDMFDEDGVMSFVNDIGMLQAGGMCDGERLLKYIHQYSDRRERKNAAKTYNEYIDSLVYTTNSIDEDGNPIEIECTKYVSHVERMRKGSRISKRI